MESSPYLPSIDVPYMDYTLILQENLEPFRFFKNLKNQ